MEKRCRDLSSGPKILSRSLGPASFVRTLPNSMDMLTYKYRPIQKVTANGGMEMPSWYLVHAYRRIAFPLMKF